MPGKIVRDINGAPKYYIPAVTALIYFLFSVLWIVFSDDIVASLVRDPVSITALQTIKGLGFVLVSSLLIFVLLRAPIGRLARYNVSLVEAKKKARESEEKIRLQGELLRLTSSMAKTGGWEFDPATGKGTWTEEVAVIHEVDPGAPIDVEHGLKFYPEPYRQTIEQAIKDAVTLGVSYDLELELITAKGNRKWVRTIGQPVKTDGKITKIRGTFQDITESKTFEKETETSFQFLRMINEIQDTREIIRRTLLFFQQQSGCEALGLRLNKDGDYPYYEVRGFSPEFVAMESSLCRRDSKGEIVKDSSGNPSLGCVCGTVIKGRTDPSKPFFSPGGSFWANDTARLLATTSDDDGQNKIRNRCNGEGYESVALIPLRHGGECLGLLQLNDRRKNMFTPQIIASWERLAGYLAVALSERRAYDSGLVHERQYRSLFENMLDGFAYCRMIYRDGKPEDFIYLDVNASFERLTGLAGVAGKKVSEVIPGLRESSPELFEKYARVAETGFPERFESRIPQLGIWLDIAVYSPARGEFTAVFDNITSRKLAEEKAERLKRILLALRNVNQLITREFDREKLIRGACANLVETRGFEKCWLAVMDDNGAVTEVAQAGWGQEFAGKEKHLRSEQPPACITRAMASESIFVLNDETRLELCGDCSMKPLDAGSLSIVAAMKCGGQNKGVIGANVPGSIPVDEEELSLFQELADDIGFALNNLEEIQSKALTELELLESEERFRQVAETAGEWIWEVDEKGSYTYVSPAVEKLLGYKPEELVGRVHFYDLFTPDVREVLKTVALDALGRKEPFRSFLNSNLHKNGGTVILESSGSPVLDDRGELAGYRGVDIDVTARLIAEEELKASENKLRSIFDTANVGIAVTASRELKEVNDELCHILGYSREELVGRNTRLLYATDDDYTQVGEMIDYLRRRSEANRELCLVRKDGSIITAALGMVSIDTWHPENGVTVTVRDITRQKEAERALTEESTRRRQLFEQTPVGIVEIEPGTTRILEFNEMAYRQLGYSAEEFAKLTIGDIEALETPGDTKVRISSVILEGKTEFDTMHRTKHGEIKNVHVIAQYTTIAGKKVYQCIWEDITERKRAELVLKQDEERYRSIFEGMNDAIFFADPKTGIILDINRRAEALLGRSREEIIGMHQGELHPPARIELSRYQFTENVKQEKVFDGENEVIRKDGTVVPVIISESLVDLGGRQVFMGVFHDITRRKHSEESTRLSEERYRIVSDIITDFAFSCTRTEAGEFKVDWMAGGVKSITGYSGDEIKGHGCWKFLVNPEDAQIFEDNIASLQPEEFSTCELRIIDREGREHWLQCRARVIEEQDTGAHRLFGGVQDVTERKAADEALLNSEQKIQVSYLKLRQTLEGTIAAITRMSEMKDPYTAGHQRRVAYLACAIAREMKLPDETIEGLRIAAMVHDVGKMQVPAEILTKPGRLNPIEFQMIKTHASSGQEILQSVDFPWPVALIVSQHHERLDGSGYPAGIADGSILVEARILGVADTVEAMASHRPYRAALGIQAALEEIRHYSGILYDTDVVGACVKLFSEGFIITE